MKVLAPGKIILSGEHAVVYGMPALAMAVNRYVTVRATDQISSRIAFDFSDFSYQRQFTLRALQVLKKRIKDKYQRFVQGEFSIRDVLHKPVELAQFAFSLFLEMLNIKLTRGIKIHVASTIPMGCGMGSSAATVLSMLHAIAHHFKIDLTQDMFLRLGLEAENLQHGYSSGLDLQVSLQGGCLFMKDGLIHKRSIPTVPMFLVNTGQPQSSTGVCVETVKPFFQASQLSQEFAAVTEAFDAALQSHDVTKTQEAIRENHKLLSAIRVVPQRIQTFIADIEKSGGAAKICGAGSVEGEQSGIVLVVTEDEVALKNVCEQYQFPLLAIQGEARGVHLV